MSNENNNEAKVIDMTATENENMVEISAQELIDLRENNDRLIAERETLIAERETLTAKLSALEKKLTETEESYDRVSQYWRQEEDKVCALKQIVRSIPINSFITPKELLNAMVVNM